jgi:hypothetical protein
MRKNREITIVGRTVWPVITLTAGVAVLLAWMLLMARAMWTLLGLGILSRKEGGADPRSRPTGFRLLPSVGAAGFLVLAGSLAEVHSW